MTKNLKYSLYHLFSPLGKFPLRYSSASLSSKNKKALLPLDPDGFISGLSKAALTVQNISLNTSLNSMSQYPSTCHVFYIMLLSLLVSKEISVHEHSCATEFLEILLVSCFYPLPSYGAH